MLCLPKNGIQAFSVNFLAVEIATLSEWALLRYLFIHLSSSEKEYPFLCKMSRIEITPL